LIATIGIDNARRLEIAAFNAVYNFVAGWVVWAGSSVPIAYDWLTTGVNYRLVTGSLLLLILAYCIIWTLFRGIQIVFTSVFMGLCNFVIAYLREKDEREFQRALALERARPVPPAPIVNVVSPYFRKRNPVYGDARPADDYEVDQGLRDNLGGLTPLFKD
jgi:hypothetical protein